MRNVIHTATRSRLGILGAALCAALVGCGTTTSGSAAPTSAAASSDPVTSQNAGAPERGLTPAGALTYFVTQVLEGHYKQTCLAIAPAAPNGQNPQQACSGTQYNTVVTSLRALHNAWAKPGVKLPPTGKVKVADTTPAAGGSTVTIPDTAVTVDGQTLHALELIGSTNAGSSSMTFQLTKIDKKWIVTNFNVSI